MLRSLPAAIVLVALSLSGCSKKTDNDAATNQLTANDFEGFDGWPGDSPTAATITRDKAHSGKYSVRVMPGFDYGVGYSNPLSKLSVARPNKIKVSAWVMVPSAQALAQLVTEIKDPATNQNQLWEGIDLAKAVKKFDEWQKVEKTITIPAATNANSRILIYPWRGTSEQPVYVDDIVVTLAD